MLRINSNIPSLIVQRNLEATTRSIARALERLSSGKRINSARDDVSGAAIAVQLRADINASKQNIRNINDATSLLNVADSAIASQIEIVQRMREIAVQSANGTLSLVDRESLDTELQLLYQEFQRITETTEFNGQKLLDGSLQTLQIQVGPDQGQKIDLNFSSTRAAEVFTRTAGTGTFSLASTAVGSSSALGVKFADFNGDGILDQVFHRDSSAIQIALGNGDGTFGSLSSIFESFAGYGPNSIATTDVNNDGRTDVVSFFDNSVYLGNGDGSFASAIELGAEIASIGVVGDFNDDGNVDIVRASAIDGQIQLHLGLGNGQFSDSTVLPSGFSPLDIVTNAQNGGSLVLAEDFDGDGHLDIAVTDGAGVLEVMEGDGQGGFEAPQILFAGKAIGAGDISGDGRADIITEGGYYTGSASGYIANAVPSVPGASQFFTTDFDSDGDMDIFGQTSAGVQILINEGSAQSFSLLSNKAYLGSGLASVAVGDLNGDGIADYTSYNSLIANYIAETEQVSAADDVSVRSQAEAQDLLKVLDTALNDLVGKRSQLGAQQNRLEFSQSALLNSQENFSESLSRLEDADIAEETSVLIRQQILQQAQIATLAQANFTMQAVLQLLR